MKKLTALSMALALTTLLLGGGLAKAYDQPTPPLIQLFQKQESPMEPQPGAQEEPQAQEEQPQQEQTPEQDQPAPEQPPQDDQQQYERG